jgi:hypothetical protein
VCAAHSATAEAVGGTDVADTSPQHTQHEECQQQSVSKTLTFIAPKVAVNGSQISDDKNFCLEAKPIRPCVQARIAVDSDSLSEGSQEW